jgi:histidyl-tRNA synthetase
VREFLDDARVPYDIDPTLVRGLDYYTRTVFEFESAELGAQNALGGGGRYDGLVELLGGPPTPGVGWAAGIERILLAASAREEPERDGIFVALAKDGRFREGFALMRKLRASGRTANIEQAGRSFKGQMKHADRLGARYVVILGDEIEIKDMSTGEQRAVESAEEVVEALR